MQSCTWVAELYAPAERSAIYDGDPKGLRKYITEYLRKYPGRGFPVGVAFDYGMMYVLYGRSPPL